MLHFDQGGELKRTFLITAVDRNKNPALRLRALQEIASGRDAEAFDRALDFVESWPRDDKREGVKVVLQALAEKKIGRRDQANNWIWRCANMTREVHEEYAVQRWPETKRLLGLLVNSSGGAHARNARRLVHQARLQDRRLSAALLAAAIPHTAEAGEVINGARTRMSRKPAALARELLRNFPKGRGKAKRRRRRKGAGEAMAPEAALVGAPSTARCSTTSWRSAPRAKRRPRPRAAALAPSRGAAQPVDADPEAAPSSRAGARVAGRCRPSPPRRSRRGRRGRAAPEAARAPQAGRRQARGGGAASRSSRSRPGAKPARSRRKPAAQTRRGDEGRAEARPPRRAATTAEARRCRGPDASPPRPPRPSRRPAKRRGRRPRSRAPRPRPSREPKAAANGPAPKAAAAVEAAR